MVPRSQSRHATIVAATIVLVLSGSARAGVFRLSASARRAMADATRLAARGRFDEAASGIANAPRYGLRDRVALRWHQAKLSRQRDSEVGQALARAWTSANAGLVGASEDELSRAQQAAGGESVSPEAIADIQKAALKNGVALQLRKASKAAARGDRDATAGRLTSARGLAARLGETLAAGEVDPIERTLSEQEQRRAQARPARPAPRVEHVAMAPKESPSPPLWSGHSQADDEVIGPLGPGIILRPDRWISPDQLTNPSNPLSPLNPLNPLNPFGL
jgi:hypothetical protein